MTTVSVTQNPLAFGWDKFNIWKPFGFGFGGLLLGCALAVLAAVRVEGQGQEPPGYTIMSANGSGGTFALVDPQSGLNQTATIYVGESSNVGGTVYDQAGFQDESTTSASIQSPLGTPLPPYRSIFLWEPDTLFSPTSSGNYTFYAVAAGPGWGPGAYGSITVNVVDGPPPSATITADSTSITLGQSTTIHADFTFPPSDSSVGSNIYQGGTALQDGSAQTHRDYTFTPTASGNYTFYAKINTQYITWGQYGQVMVSVQAPPSITTQPTSQVVIAAQNATFSVAATGVTPISYQWQRLPAGSSTWSNLTNGGAYSGTTTATLTVSNTTFAMNGDQFLCVATNPYGNTPSAAASLTVNHGVPITTQPASVTVPAGSGAGFSVTIIGTPPVSYQWQVSSDGGSTWNNLTDGNGISGSATSRLGFPASTSVNGYQFRVIVSDPNGTSTSNAAVLTVGPAGGVPTLPPWALASFIALVFLGAKATLTKKRQTI